MSESKASMQGWQAAVLIINSVAALSLNALIYFIVYRNQTLRTPFNFTILNVSFADILVSLNMLGSAVFVITENNKVVDKRFCNSTGFITLLSFVGSVMCLAAVSFNRYLLVCHWRIYKKVFTKIGIAVCILSVWGFSILISIPPLAGWSRFTYYPGRSICFADWSASISYMVFMISVCFCGPILVTLLSLYFILKTKRSNEYKLENTRKGESLGEIARIKREARKQKIAKEERKITISIVVIAVVFMIAWGPFVVVMFVRTIGKQNIPLWIDFGVLFLGCLNSTANPIVYLTLNSNFRKEFNKLRNCSTQNDSTETKSMTIEGTPKLTPRLLRFENKNNQKK